MEPSSFGPKKTSSMVRVRTLGVLVKSEKARGGGGGGVGRLEQWMLSRLMYRPEIKETYNKIHMQ